MKLKVLKDFEWAHRHVHVKAYVKGQVFETEDKDLIRVGKEEKWVSEAKAADVNDSLKNLQEEILALQAQLGEAEENEIAGIDAQLAEKQAAINALQN